MDTAVALVQAYLQINGYFAVVEYPVLEASRLGPTRTVTDLDVLSFRFAGAGHQVIHRHGHRDAEREFEPDPALGCPSDRPDMIVGEVKEGAARFNSATQDPDALSAALARFGCCHPTHAGELARTLLTHGHVNAPSGMRSAWWRSARSPTAHRVFAGTPSRCTMSWTFCEGIYASVGTYCVTRKLRTPRPVGIA